MTRKMLSAVPPIRDPAGSPDRCPKTERNEPRQQGENEELEKCPHHVTRHAMARIRP